MSSGKRKIRDWEKLLPEASIDISDENMNLFFETMFDRQRVWKKRFILNEKRPWSDDTIIQNNKFTNVYRELDRSSQWQIKNIILKNNSDLNYVWKLIVFRLFNKPELFDFLEGVPSFKNFDKEIFLEGVTEFRNTGQSPFTNAYYINSKFARGTRDECYCLVSLEYVHNHMLDFIKLLESANNPNQIMDFLVKIPGVANFVAHEIYQDLTYLRIYSDCKIMKFTQNDFTNVGPGASLGVRLIFPSLQKRDYDESIKLLRDISSSRLSDYGEFDYLSWNKKNRNYEISTVGELSLHQIEMWLCEFSKYWKMKVGLGKQRSKFVPISKKI